MMASIYLSNLSEEEVKEGVLIVGDGNFSFSKWLVHQRGKINIKNLHIHVTSFDTDQEVATDENSLDNIAAIKQHDQTYVSHGVDATCLENTFPGKKFGRIIFNFPHVGGKSNIKKCRKLLADLFSSCNKHLISSGCVIIALCKGQSGLPCDSSRKSYGNSWQVASHASLSGFVLSKVVPFEEEVVEYTSAGYRSQVQVGFRTNGALILQFTKFLPRLRVEKTDISESKESSCKMFHQYLEKSTACSTSNFNFSNPIRCLSKKLFSTMETFLADTFGQDLEDVLDEGYLINSAHDDVANHLKNLLRDNILSENSSVCTLERDEKCSSPISPYSTHVSNYLKIYSLLPESVTGDSKLSEYLKDFIFQNFNVICTSEMKSNMTTVNKIESDKYDSEATPYFVDKIPKSFWTSFQPEITVSSQDDASVQYDVRDSSSYELLESEQVYFQRSCSCNETEVYTSKRIFYYLDYHLLAECNFIKKDCLSEHLIVREIKFNLDAIFVGCLKVNDLRLITSNDDSFSKHLSDHILSSAVITTPDTPVCSYIKFPLAFRHDLCFWLDSEHTEEILFAAIRLIAKDCIHSVRLLKVLRHEESDLISYCYRMIYSRCDGPLSHVEVVEIQNCLRKYLLQIGFKLR